METNLFETETAGIAKPIPHGTYRIDSQLKNQTCGIYFNLRHPTATAIQHPTATASRIETHDVSHVTCALDTAHGLPHTPRKRELHQCDEVLRTALQQMTRQLLQKFLPQAQRIYGQCAKTTEQLTRVM